MGDISPREGRRLAAEACIVLPLDMCCTVLHTQRRKMVYQLRPQPCCPRRRGSGLPTLQKQSPLPRAMMGIACTGRSRRQTPLLGFRDGVGCRVTAIAPGVFWTE